MRLKIFCGFLLFIFACSKNQWKQPTSICFDWGLSSTQFLSGDLVFQTGQLKLGSFVFDGVRAEGGNVYFDTDYEQIVEVPLKGTAMNAEKLTFDVPQGIYNSMELRLGTNEKPSRVLLEGELTLANSDPVFVCLELEGAEQWTIVAKNQARQQEPLALTSEKTSASILLQPHNWITESQRPLWESAEMVVVDGRTTILINKETNVTLYQTISKLFLDSEPYAFVES